MRSCAKSSCIWPSKKSLLKLSFLLPSLAGVSVFVLLPFADVVRRSFTTAVNGQWNGLAGYELLAGNQAFMLAVKNTLRFTAVCLPILIGLGLLTAVLLSRLPRIQTLKACYLLPLAAPAATVVLVWRILFADSGLLNGLLARLSLAPVRFMESDAAFWVLVASYIWKNLGYTVVLWLAGTLSIPESILEAAQVDGASKRQCFYRIILPNLKPTLYTITVLSFLNSFKVFREAYLVAGAYPHESMYLLQHLFNNWFTGLEFDKMAAAAVCTALTLGLGSIGLKRLWDRQESW